MESRDAICSAGPGLPFWRRRSRHPPLLRRAAIGASDLKGSDALQVDVELDCAATGGLLLFLSSRLFLGIAIDGDRMITYGGGGQHHWREKAPPARRMHLRLENREHIVTFHYSLDGKNWVRHGLRLESSGYNVNTSVPGQGESLRPALFASGDGAVRFRNYRYRAI